jgi:hypothetical protein
MSLLGEVLAGWAGEKLVHDEKIIASTRMGCIKKSLLRLLIHTNVIHIQELRELRRVVGIAGPRAADRQIQNNKKRVVEVPFARDIIRCDLEKLLIVEISADLMFLSLDGIDVEIIPE